MPSTTLVTGAAGFIGTHVVRALAARGARVRAMLRPGERPGAWGTPAIETVVADLRDPAALRGALDGVDSVYHLAASTRPGRWLYRRGGLEAEFRATNAAGTRALAEACRGRVRSFVFFSSTAVMGFDWEGVCDERLPMRPCTPYGASKAEAEDLLTDLYRREGFPARILRPGMVFGPGHRAMMLILNFLRRGLMPTFGTGAVRAPLCYVEDVARAALLLEEKGADGSAYFVAGESVSMREFGEAFAEDLGVRLWGLAVPGPLALGGAAIKDALETALGLRFCPLRMDIDLAAVRVLVEGKSRSTDTARLRALGWTPQVPFREGVRRAVAWYKEEGLL